VPNPASKKPRPEGRGYCCSKSFSQVD